MRFISKHIRDFFIAVLAVVAPVIPMVLTILFLVGVDFIFAIYRQFRQDPSQITSRKMSNSVTKILTYTLTILGVYFLQTYIVGDTLPLTKITSALIGLVELKSIDETFKLLNGYSIWDKVSSLLKRGTSTTKDIVDEVEKEG